MMISAWYTDCSLFSYKPNASSMLLSFTKKSYVLLNLKYNAPGMRIRIRWFLARRFWIHYFFH